MDRNRLRNLWPGKEACQRPSRNKRYHFYI
jgi:hypothetical protein